LSFTRLKLSSTGYFDYGWIPSIQHNTVNISWMVGEIALRLCFLMLNVCEVPSVVPQVTLFWASLQHFLLWFKYLSQSISLRLN
jgi:hypothetical protein